MIRHRYLQRTAISYRHWNRPGFCWRIHNMAIIFDRMESVNINRSIKLRDMSQWLDNKRRTEMFVSFTTHSKWEWVIDINN